MGDLAATLQDDAAFTGYGVTTGLGSSSINPDGGLNLGVGPDQQMGNYAEAMMGGSQSAFGQAQDSVGQAQNPYLSQAFKSMQAGQQGLGQQQSQALQSSGQMMNNAMQGTAQREQDIYNRAMAMQQPGLDAQRAQSNAMEYASGRGGVMWFTVRWIW